MHKNTIRLKYYPDEDGENQIGFEYSEAGFRAATAFYELLEAEGVAIRSDLPQFDAGYDKSAAQKLKIWVKFVVHSKKAVLLPLAFLRENASLVDEVN